MALLAYNEQHLEMLRGFEVVQAIFLDTGVAARCSNA